MKKFIKILSVSLFILLTICLTFVGITFPPVLGGMAAKTICSCVLANGRTIESVRAKELQVFPGLSQLAIQINEADSSVTASFLWHTSEAIYRKGLGCTLLAEQTKEEVKTQRINLPNPPAINQDTVMWPMGNKLTDTILAGVDYAAVNQAVQQAFVDRLPDQPIHTHGVVVVYNGEIISEQYADGFTYQSRMMGWSMNKSITNALIGILVNEGKLDIYKPAPIEEWKNDERKTITLHHLLQASSGLAWTESYFNPVADFHQMFIHRDDKAGYAINQKLANEPGTHFQYSSGTTNILSYIIRKTVDDNDYYRFPYEKLFYKTGMFTALLEPDASGTFVGSSYCYASARDWARFGLLYLQDGVWNKERILPEGWVAYSTTPAPAAPQGKYGAQWWLNAGSTGNPTDRYYPELPTDAYWADGFEEQFVMIIPSKNLVIVRLGVTHNQHFSMVDLVKGILAALPT